MMRCIFLSPGEFYPEVVAVAPLVRFQQLLLRQAGEGRERHAVDLRSSTAKGRLTTRFQTPLRGRTDFLLCRLPPPLLGQRPSSQAAQRTLQNEKGREAAGRPAIVHSLPASFIGVLHCVWNFDWDSDSFRLVL